MLQSLFNDPKFRELCRIGSWTFSPKAGFLELQPADFYAYESYKHMDNRIVGLPRFPSRQSAKDLVRRIDVAHYWDGTRLKKWLKNASPVVAIFEERERVLFGAGRKDLI